MKNNSSRGVSYVFVAICLLTTIILIAIILGSLHSSVSTAPITTIINSDYQMESAMIIMLQKANNNPKLPKQKINKEIMPNIFLELTGTPEKNNIWSFMGNITGYGVNKKFTAQGNVNAPDNIIFLH